MQSMKKFLLFVLGVIIVFLGQSQTVVTDQHPKTSWNTDETEDFYNQQAKLTLVLADSVLKMNTPALQENLLRKMALMLIDNVLHDEPAPTRPAVQTYFRKCIENSVSDIRITIVEKGAVIWKLYNHAFIVKTPTVTVGFDITRGLSDVEGFSLNERFIHQLIDVTDILFISHVHSDHADKWVTEQFLNRNKPVVAPENVWNDQPFSKRIIRPERKAHVIQSIYLPLKEFSIKIVNYPGHQKSLINNVYLVISPEGISFAHTGDQYNYDDFEWIDQVGNYHRVDVAMPNCWTALPKRFSDGFRPGLIIPGHENEMGHPVTQRKPYWLNEVRWSETDSIPYPFLQVHWGEKFHYIP